MLILGLKSIHGCRLTSRDACCRDNEIPTIVWEGVANLILAHEHPAWHPGN
jgi:hypothetical protein